MRIHLDTDFAGDTDDACALALLLGLPDVEIVGITTVADPTGARAGYVEYFLELAGRADVPVAAGAGASLTTGDAMGDLPDHDLYWPEPVEFRPPADGEATALILRSIEAGATVAAIGPYTNLALVERASPGALAATPVVAMGGWIDPPDDGLPPWGPHMDWNVQCDTTAAQTLLETADLCLVPLPLTLRAHLRNADLGRLRESGRLGALLARQARAHGERFGMSQLGRTFAALPDDLLNFQYDPVACAVAAGWSGATVEPTRLTAIVEEHVLRFERDADGHPARVVTSFDVDAFRELWLAAVETADRR
jgi:inosine-uridine nucleoside N-ribohydrolase